MAKIKTIEIELDNGETLSITDEVFREIYELGKARFEKPHPIPNPPLGPHTRANSR